MNIHFIAIGGAVMHQLAIDLALQGHTVTGSDDEIFDPARKNLLQHDLLPEVIGWNPEKIHTDLDAVVLGMHAHNDNPELKKALDLQLDIYSFPEFVYNQTQNAIRVSISGSHGKTTTTAMIMHVLQACGKDFDYLVGSKLDDFDRSVSLHGAPILIAEGDEYPASSLKKVPKFLFLKPAISVLTGIAWDHINIFPTYENYFHQFELFLESMSPGSYLIYNTEDPEVVRCVEAAGKHLDTFGYTTLEHQNRKGVTYIKDASGVEYALKIFGKHNLSNLAASKAVCLKLGVSETEFCESISTFRGTAKRLELIAENQNGFVKRDFAHAPSKVQATLQAVKEQFADFSIVACLELHTYSSLDINFMSDYAHSLDSAQHRYVYYSRHALEIKRLPEFSPDQVIEKFDDKKLRVFTDTDDLYTSLLSISDRPIVYLMMSSGNYGGMDLERMKALIGSQ